MNLLGRLQYQTGDLRGAVASWRTHLAAAPADIAALSNLAGGLLDEGLVADATLLYRRALKIDPAFAPAHSGLLLALHYDPSLSPRQIADEHFRFGQVHEPRTPRIDLPPRDRDADRIIRLAYVSPNLRRHAVAAFVAGVLRNHDRTRFQVTCYSDAPGGGDDLTATLRGYCDAWRDTSRLADDALAQRIAEDRQDILIDLTGHLGGNRLLAFARKPAPVQVTYLGYQSTTGLRMMDFRVSDAVADPPGATEHLHTERLVRLPCFFAYDPPAGAEEVRPPPVLRQGAVTFGSLNHPAKHNDRVLACWARLLERVPGSRLMLLVASGDGEGRLMLEQRLARLGVSSDRLRLVPRRPHADYLRLYHEIDIALDPWPFSGHTTTCDALFMGVPVVTLASATYASGMTASVLMNLPMPQWIAESEARYLDIAAELAGDMTRLSAVRGELRRRMLSSPVMDAANFTRSLEQAYRWMWSQWCAGAAGRVD